MPLITHWHHLLATSIFIRLFRKENRIAQLDAILFALFTGSIAMLSALENDLTNPEVLVIVSHFLHTPAQFGQIP